MTLPPDPDKKLPTLPQTDAVVVGGGPAGLRAAEVLAAGGWTAAVYEQKLSPGRKFLVAGKGGLNLTHSEAPDPFISRYVDEPARWRDLLAGCGPAELRAWAAALDVETYVGTSGRVFPRGQQAATLLRRWIARLKAGGIVFHVSQRLETLAREADGGWTLGFRDVPGGQARTLRARAVVLALGGASWPQTGSDGHWVSCLSAAGIDIAPWQPANCGSEVDWDTRVLAAAEGLPLKNVVIEANGHAVAGEALITRYGLEGGAVYRLGRTLRAMERPTLRIDFKPGSSVETLLGRLSGPFAGWAGICARLKIGGAARALLEFQGGDVDGSERNAVVDLVKNFTLELRGPRPIAEAISSAGGIRWDELNGDLMLTRLPGIFAAGEMIDWEAPTGGYLLQGCFATGTRAGQGAARWLRG